MNPRLADAAEFGFFVYKTLDVAPISLFGTFSLTGYFDPKSNRNVQLGCRPSFVIYSQRASIEMEKWLHFNCEYIFLVLRACCWANRIIDRGNLRGNWQRQQGAQNGSWSENSDGTQHIVFNKWKIVYHLTAFHHFRQTPRSSFNSGYKLNAMPLHRDSRRHNARIADWQRGAKAR